MSLQLRVERSVAAGWNWMLLGGVVTLIGFLTDALDQTSVTVSIPLFAFVTGTIVSFVVQSAVANADL